MDILDFNTTEVIPVSKSLIGQVIGQDSAVDVIRRASSQRRHVLLIGEPGTGKSLLGMALAEMLPKEKLVDVIAFPNPVDENQPVIRIMPAGQGRQLVRRAKIQASSLFQQQNWMFLILMVLAMIAPWWARSYYKSDVMFAAFFLGGMFFVIGFILVFNMSKRFNIIRVETPKVIVDNFGKNSAPFWDATGAHAGALLGDILHDPLQSGGLGTPAHERVVAGMIHKANLGVLFVDEIATLDPHTQQDLLTSLQEGKFSITGQSERSSGAMVRTEPVPCNFILVAAGNVETVRNLHPALRSRIKGYGYEVLMKDSMPDTVENRFKIAQFVAQEVRKDKRIPHFSKAAVGVIIERARRMADRKGHLTLRLRDLGGVVRTAGDIARESGSSIVLPEHVVAAKKKSRSLEQQMADEYIDKKKEYEIIVTSGSKVGRVNGLAVIGGPGGYSGIMLPIEAEVTPGKKGDRLSEIIATGKLGDIAKEAVKNVSALIKRYFGEDVDSKDLYVQFLQTYEGVEGDSASIAVATAVFSALKKIPIKQSVAMTGSLSVRGDVLPIGGVSSKIEAAVEAGVKTVIVPKSNVGDITLDKNVLSKIKIVPVETIVDVLKNALDWKGKKTVLRMFER
ncbi:ATP-dependent protease LonB [Candidatus Woesearchaeota archaeon]|nr:ATP-dependent protease LonB [Candidatus Woesearchaeota archaeon]